MIDVNQLWSEKYRPQTIADCILPKYLKDTFQECINNEYVPNLLLSGTPGVGKTTVAKALLIELDFDYIVINGSLNGNIDTLRTEIQQFASTISFSGKRKYVILDEADYLNPQSTQPALRNFMEEFSKNCGFILTCNFKNRIIDPLHSRCSVIDFKLQTKEKQKIAMMFMTRVQNILSNENIEFDDKAIGNLILKHFPDFRRMLNELQRHSATGKIDESILVNFADENFKMLIHNLKNKEFKEVRKWVAQNTDIEPTQIYRKLYDFCFEYLKEHSIPQLVLHIAEYSYKDAFVSDHEVNLVACLTEIMVDCEFK
jgi:DNA polymerase III delta prime subunit